MDQLVCALVCAAVAAMTAWVLTGFMVRQATTDAPILHSRVHILIAAVLGALAGLAHSWAEGLAFVVLAVASALLTVIDLAEERLPDRIVLPLLLITGILLTLAAWTTGGWPALARAGLGAVAMFVLYFLMMLFSPDLGFGDVKLAAIVGAFCGWFGWGAVVLGFGAAWITFAIAGIVMLATRKRDRTGSLAFGPFMVLGAVLGVFWAGAILPW